MAEYQFGSIVDRNFRLTLQRLADEVNVQGKTIQDLVAEGQLTEEQYAELIEIVNNMVKSGNVAISDLSESLRKYIDNKRNSDDKIKLDELSSEVIAAIEGGESAVFELLSIPKNESVTTKKLSKDIRENLTAAKNIVINGDFKSGAEGVGTRNSQFEVTNEVDFNGEMVGKITFTEQSAYSRITLKTDNEGHNVGDIFHIAGYVYPTKSSRPRISVGGTTDIRRQIPANEWSLVSGNIPLVSEFSTIGIYPDETNVGNDVSYVWGIIAINLTQTFGKGREPEESKVREILSGFNNNWFDGDASPFIKNEYLLDKIEEESDETKEHLNKLEKLQFPAKNIIRNGDFSDGTQEWTSRAQMPEITADNNILKVTALEDASVYVTQRTVPDLNNGEKIFIAFDARANKNGVVNVAAATANLSRSGTSRNLTFTENIKRYNIILDITSEDMGAIRLNGTDFTTAGDFIELSNFIAINLTQTFGKGQEPDEERMNNLLKKFENYWFDGMTPAIMTTKEIYLNKKINEGDEGSYQESTYGLKISTLADTTTNITNNKDVSPILFGVKTTNERNILNGNPETPRPIGWLYRTVEKPVKLLYASGTPDNMKEICEWDHSLHDDPMMWAPFITKDGDIIFVYRGEILNNSTINPSARRNPIIYPSGDYSNPYIIDFGDREKPTSWLQNCGADYIYDKDCLIFAEYTRLSHEKAYVWKVDKPFSDPDNWRIVKEFMVSRDGEVGIEHCHTINYDPFSDKIYLTTGDTNEESKLFESSDHGETWDLIIEGSARHARLLNFVFTKERVYWASDDYDHYLLSCDRDENGVPDFNNLSEDYDFNNAPPTYVTALIEEPYGLLILNRHDGQSRAPLAVYFYDLKAEKMHIIESLEPLNGESATFGFRCAATNWYHPKGDNRIICGFDYRMNDIEGLGNMKGDRVDRINNLSLEVYKK